MTLDSRMQGVGWGGLLDVLAQGQDRDVCCGSLGILDSPQQMREASITPYPWNSACQHMWVMLLGTVRRDGSRPQSRCRGLGKPGFSGCMASAESSKARGKWLD
jgi:hypothetical protein